ncbi:type VII secretion protein EccB [Mycobacterium sp. pUA109]|uniref:type VII secretion protein EccB n=1 Tax=Mycobacterium sp. pUA109 TaxID=3238982 RepID=UPI00351B7BD9
MTSRPATRLQVSGYRFASRRIEQALRGGEVATAEPPARVRSLATGCLLAALMVFGGAALAFVRPHPGLDGAPIVMAAESGALYVRVDDTLHPVLNLASARLIAATAASPRRVRQSDIDHAKRGPLLGIPGAPPALAPPLSDTESGWTVCDAGSPPTTTVIAGPVRPLQPLAAERRLLVTTGPGGAGRTYLLYGGRRAAVSLTDPAVTRALRWDGQPPPTVSALLLNAVPEAPPITAPRVTGAATLPEFPVGGATTLCVTWAQPPSGGPETTVSAGAALPLPPGAAPVALAQADGAGPALDAVYLPPGNTAYVRASGVRYLIAGTGVRFAIPDDATARSLGLTAPPTPAPWPMLVGLPQGPELSRQHALVARDVVPSDPA